MPLVHHDFQRLLCTAWLMCFELIFYLAKLFRTDLNKKNHHHRMLSVLEAFAQLDAENDDRISADGSRDESAFAPRGPWENTPGTNCPQCDSLLRLIWSEPRLREERGMGNTERLDRISLWLFHSQCNLNGSCSGVSGHDMAKLCSLCKHLRLQHIISCLNSEWFDVKIGLGTLADMIERKYCQQCNFLLNAFESKIESLKGAGENVLDGFFTMQFENKARSRIDFERQGKVIDVQFTLNDVQHEVHIQVFSYPPRLSYHLLAGTGQANAKYEAEQEEEAEGGGGRHDDMLMASREPVSPLIKWTAIKSMLGDCERDHVVCNEHPEAAELPLNFRVIDVIHRKIIPAREGCRYVALSYVWGVGTTGLQATMGNAERLQEDQSLINLPSTIEDAIFVCQKLGEQFLWVDQLCIIQDDDADKKDQIERMGSVYAAAHFVIVAACSTSMQSPLAGVRQDRQVLQVETKHSGLQLIVPLPHPSTDIQTSVWNSRGWTYQEGVLAKRILFYHERCSHARMYFRHQIGISVQLRSHCRTSSPSKF